jgi:hypothetical protein
MCNRENRRGGKEGHRTAESDESTYVTLDTKEIGKMLAEATLSRIKNFRW